jgi:hypothetical protein
MSLVPSLRFDIADTEMRFAVFVDPEGVRR